MTRYHQLPIAAKRAEAIARMREPAIACPRDCGTQLMPDDLLAHLEQRCPGAREPGPGSKWVTSREAVYLGVTEMSLSRWVRDGLVRARGKRGDRQYLKRDLVIQIALRRVSRRRY